MDGTLVAIAVVLAALGAAGLAAGRRGGVGAARAQAAGAVALLLLLPAVLWVLWRQQGAADRLAATGLVPHPRIRHALGVAAGGGASAAWAFRVDASPADVAAFHGDPAHHPGWTVESGAGPVVVLRRGGERLVVTAVPDGGGSRVTYLLRREP